MHKRNMNAHFNIQRSIIDLLLIIGSFFVSALIYKQIRGFSVIYEHAWMLIIFGIVFTLSMFLMRMYDVTTFQYIDRQIHRIVASTLLGTFSLSAVVFFAKQDGASRLFFLMFMCFCFASTLSARLIAMLLRRSRFGNIYTHILFIGSKQICEQYLTFMGKTSLKIMVDKRINFHSDELKTEEAFENLLIEMSVSEVVVVQDTAENNYLNISKILKISEDMGVTARLILDLYDLPESKRFVSNIGTLPVLTYHSTSFDTVQLFFKSVLDIFCAVLGLIVFSPVFLITTIAIKLESPGPALFCQTRVGRNGKRFKMYKFRSMYQDAEERKSELQAQNKIKDGLMFKIDDDPRITKVGKFIRKTSIDELPQLINVLMRNMSIVGTRPPTVDEVEKYQRHHHRRISIMPGITGMWQVNGRSEILDFEEVVELDKKYIDEWTFMLDIKLILQTVTAVIARRGAS